MDDFNFNTDQSTQQNIETYFSQLSSIDSELADLLKQRFPDLFPLPEQGNKRNELRKSFNESIRDSLDDLLGTEETDR